MRRERPHSGELCRKAPPRVASLAQSPSHGRERRRRFMIWEKLWALARVSTHQGRGVLGVNGAGRHLVSRHRERLDGRYVLLQRQPFLGALGSYSTSLEAPELKRPGSLLL